MRTSEAQADINIYSYGKATQTPPVTKYTVNVRNLRDPIGNASLRQVCKDGRAPAVIEWVAEDERVEIIVTELVGLAHAHIKHGKETYVSIGFVDHHGKWIAPAVAEIVAAAMERAGFSVSVRHQGLGNAGN